MVASSSERLRIMDTHVVRMLRLPEVKNRTGFTRTPIYDRMKLKLLPSPVNLGGHRVGWPDNEIDAVNAARIAGATDEEIVVLVCKLEVGRVPGRTDAERDAMVADLVSASMVKLTAYNVAHKARAAKVGAERKTPEAKAARKAARAARKANGGVALRLRLLKAPT